MNAILWLLLILSLLLVVTSRICFVIAEKYRNIVIQHNIGAQHLQKINAKYSFLPVFPVRFSHVYDNENIYNTVSCRDFLIYQLYTQKNAVHGALEKAGQNRKLETSYLAELNEVRAKSEAYDIPVTRYFQKLLRRAEQEFFASHIQRPVTEYCVYITLQCERMNGRPVDEKQQLFHENEICRLLQLTAQAHPRPERFSEIEDIWQAICRVERGKVSNRMRFFIYERDHYRCCCCGRNEDQCSLEIDHIYPISKGGKSIPGNLQTLCHDCNVQKGTRYIRYRQSRSNDSDGFF